MSIDIIAERQFDLQSEDGKQREITLRIGKPTPDERPGGDWICSFQIFGIGREVTETAYGVDSLQALMLAIQKAAAILAFYQRQQKLQITWLDQEDLGLGQPRRVD